MLHGSINIFVIKLPEELIKIGRSIRVSQAVSKAEKIFRSVLLVG